MLDSHATYPISTYTSPSIQKEASPLCNIFRARHRWPGQNCTLPRFASFFTACLSQSSPYITNTIPIIQFCHLVTLWRIPWARIQQIQIQTLRAPAEIWGCIIGDWSFLPLLILAFLFRLLRASSWSRASSTKKDEVCCPKRQKYPVTHWDPRVPWHRTHFVAFQILATCRTIWDALMNHDEPPVPILSSASSAFSSPFSSLSASAWSWDVSCSMLSMIWQSRKHEPRQQEIPFHKFTGPSRELFLLWFQPLQLRHMVLLSGTCWWS